MILGSRVTEELNHTMKSTAEMMTVKTQTEFAGVLHSKCKHKILHGAMCTAPPQHTTLCPDIQTDKTQFPKIIFHGICLTFYRAL